MLYLYFIYTLSQVSDISIPHPDLLMGEDLTRAQARFSPAGK